MAEMQWLSAEQKGSHYHFRVWLDTSKTAADGKPDRFWERRYRYHATPPKGWTGASLNGTAYTDWASYVQAEVELLAAADLAAIEDKVTATLPIQGQTFTPAGG